MTTLRRAFHTLKGSSRMVGLTEFGEAAWSMEQLLNTWLADQKPATDELRSVSGDAMRAFGRWGYSVVVGLLVYPLYTGALILFLDARTRGESPRTKDVWAMALALWPRLRC